MRIIKLKSLIEENCENFASLLFYKRKYQPVRLFGIYLSCYVFFEFVLNFFDEQKIQTRPLIWAGS